MTFTATTASFRARRNKALLTSGHRRVAGAVSPGSSAAANRRRSIAWAASSRKEAECNDRRKHGVQADSGTSVACLPMAQVSTSLVSVAGCAKGHRHQATSDANVYLPQRCPQRARSPNPVPWAARRESTVRFRGTTDHLVGWPLRGTNRALPMRLTRQAAPADPQKSMRTVITEAPAGSESARTLSAP